MVQAKSFNYGVLNLVNGKIGKSAYRANIFALLQQDMSLDAIISVTILE
jgi:hypothetical protein